VSSPWVVQMETKDVLTLAVAVVGLTLGLIQYHVTSRAEFLKPIREAQLDLYEQASTAAARISTLPRDGDGWKGARDDFLKLYYGPLTMVEDYRHGASGDDETVTAEQAMIAFKMCLDDPGCVGSNEMKNLSLGLAHTLRVSLGSSWGFKAAQLSGDYQDLIQKYLKLKDQQIRKEQP
jgi:hypothetical protein